MLGSCHPPSLLSATVVGNTTSDTNAEGQHTINGPKRTTTPFIVKLNSRDFVTLKKNIGIQVYLGS